MNMNTSNALDDFRNVNLHKFQNSELSASQFRRWQDCIETRCGLYFDKNRASILCNALLQRIGELNLSGYDEYLKFLLYGNDVEHEWKELYCSLVNCETSFFRHEPSFELLKEHILPKTSNSVVDCR